MQVLVATPSAMLGGRVVKSLKYILPSHLHVEFDAVKSEQPANSTIKDKQESIAEPT